MDAQQFVAEFGHIADAPGGVARLRELVLSMAFNGSLCASSQEPIESLLSDIERQRDAGSIDTRKQRLARNVFGGAKIDGPFPIPDNWRWVSLGAVGHTWGQKKPVDDFYYIDVSSIDNKAGALSENLEIIAATAAPSRARKIVKKGTLVYSTVRPYLLNIALIDRDFDREPIASTAFAVVHPWHGIEARYLYFYLRSPHFVRYVESVQIGMAYPAISDEKFYSGMVPLPPTEEQSRIVAKVEELMALCDQLEAQQRGRRELQNALRQSALQALTSAQSPHELEEGWQRLQKNFGRLFSESEDVKELRLVLMELAIQGLLTEQLGDDGNAEELLIAAQGVDTVRTRGRKKGVRSLDAVADSAPPFILPRNWTWARLADVGYFLGGGTPSKSNPEYWQGSIPWVSPKDMKVTRISSAQDQISEKALVESAAKLIPTGSLLVVVRGMILAHSFPVGLTSREVAINQDMKALCPHREDMGEFLLLLLAGSKRRFLELVERSTHGTCRLETDRFTSCVVGIPPLSEQVRIVETVNKLMRSCDALQSQLAEMRKCSANVANAAIASLTGVTMEQVEEATVKAPQTELVAPLRLGNSPDVKAQAPLATLLARHNGEMSARDLWQRFGGEIDAFYAQLKNEVAHGWIAEPEVAEMREKAIEAARA